MRPVLSPGTVWCSSAFLFIFLFSMLITNLNNKYLLPLSLSYLSITNATVLKFVIITPDFFTYLLIYITDISSQPRDYNRRDQDSRYLSWFRVTYLYSTSRYDSFLATSLVIVKFEIWCNLRPQKSPQKMPNEIFSLLQTCCDILYCASHTMD